MELRHVGRAWLMESLGELLPALLPDSSVISKAMAHEKRMIVGQRRSLRPMPAYDVAEARAALQATLVGLGA